MAITPNLFEDLEAMGREKGRAEGRAEGRTVGEAEGRIEGRQADVLDAFKVRFDVVPEAVCQAVSAEKDGDVLSAWHRGIIRAKDQAEAARIITGG